MFSHIFTSVTDFERAFAFYCGVLSELGLELRFHEPNRPWAGWHRPGGMRPFFAAFIAERPDAGDVVPGSGGIRKVRWSRAGTGKSGGVRVIYYVRTAQADLVLLTLYAKSKTDNLTGSKLKEIRRVLEE